MGLLKMYGYYFMNFITRGINNKKGEIAADSIVTQYGRILTRRYTRKILVIRTCKTLSQANPQARIYRNELIKKFPSLKVIVHLNNVPLHLNVKDAAFQRRMRQVDRRYEELAKEHESMDGSERIMGKVYRGPNGRKFTITERDYIRAKEDHYSYAYVGERVSQNKDTLFYTNFFVELLIPDKLLKQQELILKEVEGISKRLGNTFEYVEMNTNKFLSTQSLTSYSNDDKAFPRMIFSDEHLGLNSSYMSPGLVGREGILHGIDKLSYLPLFVNYFNSPGAKVGMILAKSGEGKTYLAQMLAFNFICDNIHCSVLDIKGNEWNKLRKLDVPYVEFVMNSRVGSYVNTLRLDDIVTEDTTTEELAELLDMAITGTVRILSVMVNLKPNEGNAVDLDNILREAVGKVYSNTQGFQPNVATTYKVTKDLNYTDVINVVREFCKTAVANKEDLANFDEKKADLCKLIINRCNGFIQEYNRSTAKFKKEITLAEVLNKPLVIYSMMKNAETQYSIDDTVYTFMIQYLDIKKQYIRKKQGLHTVAFYEELQRCGNMKSMMDFIAAMVTGARSNNLAVFLLLNAISTFEQEGAFKAIKSNITIDIIGKLNRDDVHELINSFDCGDIADYLDLINPDLTKKENLEKKRENYERTFALKFRKSETEYDKTMFEVIVPKSISNKLATAEKIDYDRMVNN